MSWRLFAITIALSIGAAHADAAPEPEPRLRVVAAGQPPFVLAEKTGLEGFSVDVWRSVAGRAGIAFELTRADTIEDALARVSAGDADVAVGPISVTSERAARVGFTQPYFHSSFAIASKPGSASLWKRVQPFLTTAFVAAVCVLLLVLLGVGTATWLVERRKNPEQFPSHPVRGIGNGIWFALVTMTTVGYGDRAPATVPGRVIAGIWMVIALLTTSSLTAGIASALTLSQLDVSSIGTADQLRGRPVAVVAGTLSEEFARTHGARPVTANGLDQALRAVVDGSADAVVFDRPTLLHELRQQPDLELVVSPRSYRPQGYAFAVGENDALRRRLSVGVLQAVESGNVAALERRWLGEAE